MKQLDVDGLTVVVNPLGGMLDRVEIRSGGRTLTPLHRAPWIDAPADVPPEAAPHLGVLAGDFFCAPFGRADIEPAPAHGWPANGIWSLTDERGDNQARDATFALDHTVLGAALTKTITLRAGHPVVYQRHDFAGGAGSVPIAHHAMIHVPGGARLSFSPKLFAATPTTPPEGDPARGRSILAYPQRAAGLGALALADGGTVDARTYPYARDHEDFVALLDPPTARLGWSAALATADGFLFFALKDAQVLTQTALWMTNGGRYYAPWLSRHRDVLGIEECCAHFGDGHRNASGPNSLTAQGLKTALPLQPGGTASVRYALGAIPAPPGWTEVAAITPADGGIAITDIGGDVVRVPFDTAFFD